MNLFDSGIQENWRHRIPGNAFKHGMHKTPTYNAWCEMKRRCLDPNRQNYYLYGGRGITVCERWLAGFNNFYEDMGEKPIGGERLTQAQWARKIGVHPDRIYEWNKCNTAIKNITSRLIHE